MTKLKEPTTIGELQAPTLDFSLNDLGVFFNVSNNETFPIVLTEFRDLLQENFTLDIPDITDLEEDLQILLDSITNIIEGDITFEGDNIFSGDNITFQNDVTIEGNVHLQDLTNVLINGVSLETILDDYVLDIDLTTTLDDYTLTVDSVNIASWINVNDTDLTLTKATHHNKLIALNMTTQDCVISLDGGEADWSDFQCKFVFLGDEPYKGDFDFTINESTEIELFNKYGGLDLYYKDSGWVAFFTGAASGNVKDDTPPTVTHFTLNHNTHNNNDTINFASFSIDFDLQDDLGGDIDIVLTILEDDESTPVAGIDSVDAVYNTNNNVLTLTNDNNTFDLSTGTYYMQAVITDHAGNEVTQTADTQITILDATAPNVTNFEITDPELGSSDIIDFDDFGIIVDVNDETSNTIDITFTIYDVSDVATVHSVDATYDETLTIDTHNTFSLGAGQYYIKATFSDEAGNSVEVDSSSFTISNDDVFVQEPVSKGGDQTEWEVVADPRIGEQNTIVQLDISGIIGGKTYSSSNLEINKAEYRDSLYSIWQEGFGDNLNNTKVYYDGTNWPSAGIIKFRKIGTSIDELNLSGGPLGESWIFDPANTSPDEIISSQGNRFLPAIKFNDTIGYIPLSLIPYLSQDPTSLVFNDGVWQTPVLASSGVGTTVQKAKENLDPSLVVPITGSDNAYNYDILRKLLDPITEGSGSTFSTYNDTHLGVGYLDALKSFNPYTLQINMDYIERNYDQITDLETTPDSNGGRLSTISFAIVTAGWSTSGPLTPYGDFNFVAAGIDRDKDKIFGAFNLTFTINP